MRVGFFLLLAPLLLQSVTMEELKARALEAGEKRDISNIQHDMRERLKHSDTYNKSVSMGDKMKNRTYYIAKREAEAGDANAQFTLAGIYYHGIMTKKSYLDAIKWYEKAANKGHKKAQFNLGYIYFDGRGVPKDHDRALKWFLEASKDKAGEQGDGKSDIYIAKIYDERGDNKNAFTWYFDAAELGYPLAQYELAMRYKDAKGCDKDIKKMIYYLKKAAVQSEMKSQYELALVYLKGNGVTKDMEVAKQWMQSAYMNGENRAKKILEKHNWEIKNK